MRTTLSIGLADWQDETCWRDELAVCHTMATVEALGERNQLLSQISRPSLPLISGVNPVDMPENEKMLQATLLLT